MATAASHKIYVVQKGDCLWNIAKAELGDPLKWPSIAKLNHLKRPNHILVGQKLLLPEPATAPSIQEAPAPSANGLRNKATVTPSINTAPTPLSSANANKATHVATHVGPDLVHDHDLARHVAFPLTIVYDHEFPKQTIEYTTVTPGALVTVKVVFKLKLKLAAQDASANSKYSINQDGKGEFKQTVASQLSWLSSNTKVAVDLTHMPPQKLEFMNGLSFLHNGKQFLGVATGVIYNNSDGCGVKFSVESGQLDGDFMGIKYSGKLSFDTEVYIRIEPLPLQRVPAPVRVPVRVPVTAPAPVAVPNGSYHPGIVEDLHNRWDNMSGTQKAVVVGAGVVVVVAVVVIAAPEAAVAAVVAETGEAIEGAIALLRGASLFGRMAPALAW